MINELKNRFLKSPSYIDIPPKRKLKVAHFTDTFLEINGVAHTLRQQAQLAEQTGKNLTIITCQNETPLKFGKVRNFKPIATYDLPEYQEQKLTLPPFLEVLDHIQQNGYTYIHSSTPGPMGLLALACAKVLDLPISATYHTAFPQYANYLTEDQNIEELMWRYMIWYYDQMDSIYVPSQNTSAELIKKGIKQEKIRTYPRGVDIKAFNPGFRNTWFKDQFHLNDCPKLLYVGRVSKEKNLPLLVKAFKKVQKLAPKAHLIIVGDGPYLSEMQQELKDMPCTFTGYLKGKDLAMAYASSDLFVFPSTTDTFGNVVLEAQASGLPVIVTDSGGPQENIVHNQSGLIVAQDSVEALSSAILSLIQHPNRLKQMSRKARNLMESRSFENAFAEQWNLYTQEKGATAPLN